MDMDIERARFNMVEQQIRTWEVLDTRVLDLLHKLSREQFTPEAYKNLAFADLEVPIGHGECMLPPKMEARMVQDLNIAEGDRVLEIGTGSGYTAALLAQLCGPAGHVYSVDIYEDFTKSAGARLNALGITGVTLETGDAGHGWANHGPYDVIAITGSLPLLTDDFLYGLKPGGRLFAVVGEPPVMEARLVTRALHGDGFGTASLFETSIRPLRNALQREHFTF